MTYWESHGRKRFKVINPNEHSSKDNSIKEFYDDWSIRETCDTVTLESSHPLRPPNSGESRQMIYTHECNDDEIAYFKVDMNLIDSLPKDYLGNDCKSYDMNDNLVSSVWCVTKADISETLNILRSFWIDLIVKIRYHDSNFHLFSLIC